MLWKSGLNAQYPYQEELDNIEGFATDVLTVYTETVHEGVKEHLIDRNCQSPKRAPFSAAGPMLQDGFWNPISS